MLCLNRRVATQNLQRPPHGILLSRPRLPRTGATINPRTLLPVPFHLSTKIGLAIVALRLGALASVVFVIESSFGVASFTHAAVATSSVLDLGMSALTILTDFCLSVSEGDGLAGVVMFAPSSVTHQCAS